MWLLVLLILTGGFMVVFEKGAEPAARSLPVESPLLHIRPSSVTRLSLFVGTNTMECVLREGQWFMIKPVEMRADSARMSRLVEAILAMRQQEVVDPERREKRNLTLASFGLESPRARVVVGTDLRTDELVLGDLAPLGDRVYVRLNGGEEVLGVSCHLSEILPLEVAGFQDRAAFPASVRQTVRLEVKHASGFFQLALRNGAWRIQQPYDAPADGARVEQVLQRLTSLTVAGFSETGSKVDSSSFGLGGEDTALQVSAWCLGRTEPFVLTVGKARQADPSWLYARISDAGRIGYIGREVLALQALNAESLRDRRLCDIDPALIASIALRDGDQKLVLDKNAGGGWVMSEPLRVTANIRAVGALLRTIGGLQGDEIRASGTTNSVPAEIESLPYRLALSVVMPDKGSTNETPVAGAASVGWSGRFGLSSSDGSSGWVYHEEAKLLYRVRAEDLTPFGLHQAGSGRSAFADPLTYMDCRMLDINPQQVRKITLSRQGREESVAVNAEGVWLVESPPDGQMAAGAVPALLELAAGLQADRVESLAVTNGALYGLNESADRVTFGLSGGGIQKTLLFGSDSRNHGVYAMVQGQEAVFVLRKSIADALLRPLVNTP